MEDGYFATADDGERFYRELTWLCLHQYGAFNSPVWFNVGLFHQYGVKGSQCNWHWDPETDDGRAARESLRISARLGLLHPERAATTWKTSWSWPAARPCSSSSARAPAPICRRLRSHREKLSGGGKPSGPLSFMRVYDQIAAWSRAAARPAAPPRCSRSRSGTPTSWSSSSARPRKRRRPALLIEKGGYEANFNGEAYSSIMFQNANLSVRVTDEFMQAVDRRTSRGPRTGSPIRARPGPTWPARDVLAKMAEGTWRCGDPGVQYDTTINRWHTCPNSGRINASNPCSRVHVPRRHGLQPGEHQPDEVPPRRTARSTSSGFQAACRIFFIAQEILVDHASYPTERIAENSHRFRPLGLGYSNLGSLIMTSGHALRLGRGPRPVRRDDGAPARRGQPDQRRAGRRRRARSTASR